MEGSGETPGVSTRVLGASAASDAATAREAQRRHHLRVAAVFSQDLTLWFATIGGIGLVLMGALRLALSPLLPSSLRVVVLVLLTVTWMLTLFALAVGAGDLRHAFRRYAARHARAAQRLATSTDEAARSRLRQAGPTVLVVQQPAREDPPEVPRPTEAGYRPRSGAIPLRPTGRLDHFPTPGEAPSDTQSIEPGVLDALELLDPPPARLDALLPPELSWVGVRLLAPVPPDAPWSCLDVPPAVLDETLRSLWELDHPVIIELEEADELASRLLATLRNGGDGVALLVPPGWGRAWPEALDRPAKATVIERSSAVMARGLAAWWRIHDHR